jgi:hypothetical protein
MDDSRIKDVSSLLRSFFDDETARKGGRYAEFFSSWKGIAGERLAAHSRVADIDKNNLIVEAEHPGWIQLLQLRQSEILAAVRQRFPELDLRGIVFRLARTGPGVTEGEAITAAKPGPFGPQGRDLKPEEEEIPTGARPALPERPLSLKEIEDPILRQGLESLKKAMEGKE